MDQLRHQYYDGSNQLKRVDDPVPNQPYYDDIKQTTAGTDAQYGYDAIGNLTSETGSSGSKSIEWNVSGKIARVDQSSGTLTSFGYDAQGQRIHKAFTTDNGRSVRHVYYVRDAQGNVLAIYEQRQQTGPGGSYSALALTEQPLYGSSRLGLRKLAVSPTSVATESFRRVVGQKQYELSDHLGNVRALVSDIKRPDDALAGTYKPDLLAYYGYYPFGMLQPGRSAPANGTLAGGYRYGYNGKEKDNNGELGLTTYDYGFRIYNPGLARFLSVDPLTQEYPWYTPFQFAGNSPTWAVDLDGGEEKVTTASVGQATTATIVTTTSKELVVQTAKRAVVQRVVSSSGNLVWEFFGVSAGVILRIAGLTVGFVITPRTAGDGTLTKGDPNYWQKQHAIHKADESEYQRLMEEKERGHLNSADESKLQNLIARGLGQANNQTTVLDIGTARTAEVVRIIGGAMKDGKDEAIPFTYINKKGQEVTGTSNIDARGPNQELVLVGGPAKGVTAQAISKTLGDLTNMMRAADYLSKKSGRTIGIQAWFTDTTSPEVVQKARDKIGSDNVHLFKDVKR